MTQAAYDACKKCETELKAAATCQGSSGSATCGADGKSTGSGSTDTTKCKAEGDAVLSCFLGGTNLDAGGGGD